MAEAHMAIADSRYLLAEVDRLKSQVYELQAASRVALEDRAQTAEVLTSFITSTQLDAALSTKVSLAHVSARIDAMRSEVATQLTQKADLASLVLLQNTKLDVSVFDATTWDLQKLRIAMEQDARDLFATFVAQVESQMNTKIGIEDFIRVFKLEATGQDTCLEAAALRISKMMDQLELLQSYMEGDRHHQQRVNELKGNISDLRRKQTADRNVIMQLKNATQVTKAQLVGLNEETGKVAANLQSFAHAHNERQELTQEEKNAQRARQAQLADDFKQLQTHSENLTKKLSELETFAYSGLANVFNVKLKDTNERFQDQLTKASFTSGHHFKQLDERMDKTTELLLLHKERFSQLDACVRKLASLLKETQEELKTIKGPLATLATNLNEENVAILQEIERSQNGARNIMVDYQNLLDRDKSTRVVLPSRPSSTLSNTFDGTTSASRKHKQQKLFVTNQLNTLKERAQMCSGNSAVTPNFALNATSPVRVRQSAGAIRSTKLPLSPRRAHTAELVPQAHLKVTELRSCEDNDSLISRHLLDVKQEVRQAKQSDKRESSSLIERASISFSRLAAGGSDEELFHFT